MVGFEEERERLAWLSKLTQQASQLPTKERPQALIFFILLSQIERKTVLRVREKIKRKIPREREGEGWICSRRGRRKNLQAQAIFPNLSLK